MAWTQTEIDALKAAIASGAKSISVNGRMVTYHSLAEMRQALRDMEAEVNAQSVTRRPVSRKIQFGGP